MRNSKHNGSPAISRTQQRY